MKKLISIIVLCATVALMLAVNAAAECFIPGGDVCTLKFDVKKADSSAVIKDGIISENEYVRADLSVSPEDSLLGLGWGSNTNMYVEAEKMLSTMEYYFSWDEVHGFNFAVKFKPHVIKQEFAQAPDTVGDDGIVCHGGDDFLNQTGILVHVAESVNTQKNTTGAFEEGFIYRWAVAKRTTDGQYINGYYTKGGLIGNAPVPGQDYVINYTADGYVICEYSVPFAEIKPGATVGDDLYISIGVTAGTGTPDNLFVDSYSINLGEYTYYMTRHKQAQNATFTLTGDKIANDAPVNTTTGANPDAVQTTTVVGNTTPAPTQTTEPETSIIEVDSVVTDADGEEVTNDDGSKVTVKVTEVVTKAPTAPTSPITGDPAIIAAVVAAVSACGVVVAKKRK